MPLCDGCGSSYDDSFSFCPHCGRAKPKPATLHVIIESTPANLEFAEMHLAYTGKHEQQLPDKEGKPVWGLSRWTIPVAWLAYRLVTWDSAGRPCVAAESLQWRTVVSHFGDNHPISTMNEWRDKIKAGRFSSSWFSEFVAEYPRAYRDFDASIQAGGWKRFEDDGWGGPKLIAPEFDPMDLRTFEYALPEDVRRKYKSKYGGSYPYFPYKAIEQLNPPLSNRLGMLRYKRQVSPTSASDGK